MQSIKAARVPLRMILSQGKEPLKRQEKMRSGNPRSQKQIKVEEGPLGASIFGKERVGQILVVSQSLLERRSSAYRNSPPTILEKDRTSIAARKIKEAGWGVTVSKSSYNKPLEPTWVANVLHLLY